MFVSARISIIALLILGVLTSSSFAAQLTWQDCLHEAAKNHPDLLAAQEEIVQQQAGKTISASDGLPQVSANLNASTAQSAGSGSSNSFDYGLTGTQLLFNGFKTSDNVKAAMAGIQAAKENFKFTSSTVRFQLREAFVNLLKAQELLSLTEEIYTIRKNNLQLIELRYQSGTEHKGALLNAQANLSEANYEINQAKRGLETAQRQLTTELGRKEFLPITVQGSFEVSDTVLQKPDFENIVKQNPALLKIVAQKNAATFNVKSNQADFFPEISLNGELANSDSQWPPSNKGSSAGVKVSLPLFEGGARIARVNQAKSVVRQLEQQERSIQDSAVLTLEQTWAGLQDTVENVSVQKDFLNASEERAKIAEAQYSVGLISFDDWTIIEDDLVKNKKTFLNTQVDALLAEAGWIQAKGETLEYEK